MIMTLHSNIPHHCVSLFQDSYHVCATDIIFRQLYWDFKSFGALLRYSILFIRNPSVVGSFFLLESSTRVCVVTQLSIDLNVKATVKMVVLRLYIH